MFNLAIKKRKINGVFILDLDGKILLGRTGVFFGNTLKKLSNAGQNQILLNFRNIVEIDGSGLGEIVKSFNTLANVGGKIKIVNLREKTLELMTITKLLTVFEVFENETAALNSFETGTIKRNHLKPTFIREFHHEPDDDLGLSEHPIYSNYSKYLSTSRKKTIKF
jgi:anti-sigma B factor antagonist